MNNEHINVITHYGQFRDAEQPYTYPWTGGGNQRCSECSEVVPPKIYKIKCEAILQMASVVRPRYMVKTYKSVQGIMDKSFLTSQCSV